MQSNLSMDPVINKLPKIFLPNAEQELPSCDLIVPIWNQLERTKRCLTSILQNTAGVDCHLILIDNASENPTCSFLKDFAQRFKSHVTLIQNDVNLGNIKSVNQGIQASTSDYVCVLDNDTIVFDGWLERMIRAANSGEKVGIVNPASNDLGFKKPLLLSWNSFAKKISEKEKGRYVEIATASGFCMLIKRAVLNQIGGWGEAFGMGYYEDHDYSRRAYEAGFICIHARDAFVYHEGSVSFRSMPKEKVSFIEGNRKLFETKHGKPQRIAFCLYEPEKLLEEKVIAEALKSARANNWVWVFSTRLFIDFLTHGFIKSKRFPKVLFWFSCFFTLVFKKKRFDIIYTNNIVFKGILSRLKFPCLYESA